MPKRKKNPYEFFSVAADVLAFRKRGKALELLLIQRKFPPYKNCWALPGGFVDQEEKVVSAAKRELKEETGLTCKKLTEFGSFSDPDRDPRGRVVTIAYYGFPSQSEVAKAGDDAGHVQWFSVKKLPRLAFDHHKMIRQGLHRLRHRR